MKGIAQGLITIVLLIIAAPLLEFLVAGFPPLWFVIPIVVLWWLISPPSSENDNPQNYNSHP